MKKILCALAASVATVAAAIPAQAAVTVFSDQGAFDPENDDIVEDFNDTTLVPGLTISSTVGSIGSGRFNDRTVLGSATTTFTFAQPVISFGGIFDLSPGGLGQGLRFFIDGVAVASAVPLTSAIQFYGVKSSTAFSSLRIESDSGCCAETYNLDNARFALATAPVPEPATWAMMIFGFGMIGGALRSRQRRTVRFAH